MDDPLPNTQTNNFTDITQMFLLDHTKSINTKYIDLPRQVSIIPNLYFSLSKKQLLLKRKEKNTDGTTYLKF